MVSNVEAKLNALRAEALRIRRNAWRALFAAGSGHVGASMSSADLLAGLYFHFLRIRPEQPGWPDRDRFLLSKGHANPSLVAALAQAGFFDEAMLDSFNKFESTVSMHPDMKLPGIDMVTGALGHGLPIGLGIALGARLRKRDFRTVVMIGDGELQEGSNWEAAMLAGHLKVSSLTAIIDYNKVQQSWRVAQVLDIGPLADKWRSFNWAVREIDGHNMDEIVDAMDALPFAPDRPSALIAHTVKGKGVSFAEDTYIWHSNMVTADVYQKALAELGGAA
jgi:transketolase